MTTKPFIKWVGGKTQLLPELLPILQSKYTPGKGYYEPFIGGGAALFNSTFRPATINDLNPDLVAAYRAVQQHPEELISELSTYPYSKEFYSVLREQDPLGLSLVQRAARMIYLNRCGFNGLYRVNKSGKFNVPFGKFKTTPNYCNAELIRECSKSLSKVTICQGSYKDAVTSASKGDLVYFDPPYVPLTSTSNFASYTSDGFTLDHQRELASVFRSLADRGVNVVLSNSSNPIVRELYDGFEIREVSARRNVNCDGSKRGEVTEFVVIGVKHGVY